MLGVPQRRLRAHRAPVRIRLRVRIAWLALFHLTHRQRNLLGQIGMPDPESAGGGVCFLGEPALVGRDRGLGRRVVGMPECGAGLVAHGQHHTQRGTAPTPRLRPIGIRVGLGNTCNDVALHPFLARRLFACERPPLPSLPPLVRVLALAPLALFMHALRVGHARGLAPDVVRRQRRQYGVR